MSDALAAALAEAGGPSAPVSARARLRELLLERLEMGEDELSRSRSGYRLPVAVAIAAAGAGSLVAIAPVPAELRADPARVAERGWLVVAALVGALVEAGEALPPAARGLHAGVFEERWLALSLPARPPEPEIAALAFEEHVRGVDRLRALALAMPAHVLEGVRDLRPPPGRFNQLSVAEAVARLGGRPADQESYDEMEEAVLAAAGAGTGVARPHEDPLPERRVARRILQRMAGMGKWGGYHTAFDHLSRGFEGNERRLAGEIGERLLAAGLLASKRSVGQRHVFLDPRRAQDIQRLIDDGRLPPGLRLD